MTNWELRDWYCKQKQNAPQERGEAIFLLGIITFGIGGMILIDWLARALPVWWPL